MVNKDDKYHERRRFCFDVYFQNVHGSMRELSKQRILLSTLVIGATVGLKQAGYAIDDMWFFITNILFVLTIFTVLLFIQMEALFSVEASTYYHRMDEESSEGKETFEKLGGKSKLLWQINLFANIFFISGIICATFFTLTV